MFYIWTLFWTLLLGHMVNYVAGAVSGATYDFMEATYLGIAFAVFVYIISAILPKNEPKQEA